MKKKFTFKIRTGEEISPPGKPTEVDVVGELLVPQKNLKNLCLNFKFNIRLTPALSTRRGYLFFPSHQASQQEGGEGGGEAPRRQGQRAC